MSLLDRYGIKEVADVMFYELDSADHSKPGKPVLYLDTLKVSTVEQTAENAEVRGGKGNAALMAWDYGKEITVNLEDALFSGKSLEVMYGEKLKDFTDDSTVIRNKYIKISNKESPFFKWNGETEKYEFNAAKAESLGIPWRAEGYATVEDNGEVQGTVNKGASGIKDGVSYCPFEAAMITGVPTTLDLADPDVEFVFDVEYNRNVEVNIDSKKEIFSEGEVTFSCAANSSGSKRENLHLTLDIPMDCVKSVKRSGAYYLEADKTVVLKTGEPAISGGIGGKGLSINIPVSNMGDTNLPTNVTINGSITLEIESDYYIVHYEDVCSPVGLVVDSPKLTWGYSYQTGDGSVEFDEIGKKYHGQSSITINNVLIPLSKDVDEDLLIKAGFTAASSHGLVYVEPGFYLFSMVIDKEFESGLKGRTLDISGNTFPGVYYVTAETFVRNEKTGKDEFFQLIFPKVKIVPETNTITLEAEGDPTVFNMKLKVLRDRQAPMMQLVKYKPGIYREASVAGAELMINAPEGWVSEEAELPEDWEEFEGYDQDSGLYASAWCRTEAMQLAEEEVLACAYGATRRLSDVVKFAPDFHTQRLQLGVTAVCYDGTENFVPNGNPSFTPNPVDRLPTTKNENLNVSSNYLYSQPVIEYTKEEKTHALTLFFKSEKGQTITNLFTSFTCVDTIQVVDNPVYPRVFEAFVGMDGTKDGSGVYHVGFTVYVYINDDGKARLWGDVLFDVSWMVWTKQGRRWVLNRVWNIISALVGGKIKNLLKIDASKVKTIGIHLLVELGLGRLDGVIEDWCNGVMDDGYTLREFLS